MTVTLFRTIFLYLVVVVGLRLMGKRQIGDMQPAELVVTIMISELAAIPMQDLDRPVANGVIAILALVFLELVISFVLLKSTAFRRLFCGRAAVIIRDGVIDQKLMKAMRLTVEDLYEDLRQQSIFDITEVQYAIMETNGKLSVMKKPERNTPTVAQMNLTPEEGAGFAVMEDGEINKQFTELLGLDEEKVRRLLKKLKADPEEVYLLQCDRQGNPYLVRKERDDRKEAGS